MKGEGIVSRFTAGLSTYVEQAARLTGLTKYGSESLKLLQSALARRISSGMEPSQMRFCSALSRSRELDIDNDGVDAVDDWGTAEGS